jgi:hypothetical protein
MKIDSIDIVTDGEDGKIDMWKPQEGKCVVRFSTESVDRDGMLFTKQAVAKAASEVELPLPVKLESGSKVGEVTGVTMLRSGDVLFDLKIDTDAYPDLWRAISNGWVSDISMGVSE